MIVFIFSLGFLLSSQAAFSLPDLKGRNDNVQNKGHILGFEFQNWLSKATIKISLRTKAFLIYKSWALVRDRRICEFW